MKHTFYKLRFSNCHFDYNETIVDKDGIMDYIEAANLEDYESSSVSIEAIQMTDSEYNQWVKKHLIP